MNFDFELILFYATVVCGVIALLDIIFWAPTRNRLHAQRAKNLEKPPELKLPLIIDYARSFFPVLLLVFLIRSFLFEPFRIPTGSLEPTLRIGDFILVNKYAYGIRLPVLHKKIFANAEPARGDIVVFRWPPNPSYNFIKRIIGIPGDHISYIDKTIYVNGQKISQDFEKNTTNNDEGDPINVVQKKENFLGIQHTIYQIENHPAVDYKDIIVPEGMYFAMGDNRDNSMDTRYWGFVPEKNIVGKGTLVWMSWSSPSSWSDKIRWKRIGTMIH